MRNLIDEGLSLIKYFESFRANKYSCPAGLLTIGYGHVIKPNENYHHITKEEAYQLLMDDIKCAATAVIRHINVPLNDYQYASLVSFTFNVGGAALQRSSLRQKLNRGEYNHVPEELMRWVWCGARKLKGLIKRREAEIMLYLGNQKL